MEYIVYPVGVLRKEDGCRIEIFDEYLEALDGLENFSRILVFLWFHKSSGEKRKILKVHSHGEPGYPLRGVFATRSPVRPNPIAIYNVRIHNIDGNLIEIDNIDAYPDTPVIDIKPFVNKLDCPNNEIE